MQVTNDAQQWETIRAQVAQTMLEHEAVMQALRSQALASAMFILVLGSLCFFLWRRCGCLNEAFHLEIKRHSAEQSELLTRHSTERVNMVKQHSLELTAVQMQMLHAFEGICSSGRGSSASSRERVATPTGPTIPIPIPNPMPPPLPGRR